MKNSKTIITLLAIAGTVIVASCQKESRTANASASQDKEIVLGLDGFEVTTETKTTAVTSLPSTLKWAATTGTRGNSGETRKWNEKASDGSSVSASKINTGHYQPGSAGTGTTAYNWYVSNVAITVPATGNVTLSASNTTDVICGWTAGSTSTTPAITLNHIFARTGSLTMNTQSGYSIVVNSWSIVSNGSPSGTAGTYNMSTATWSGTTALTSTTITSSSDLYLVPGNYTVSCNYTLKKTGATGSVEWQNTFTKSASVTLVGGKVNNITGTASGGAASEIVLSLSLTDWGTENLTPTFS